jgi:hypothetical protein
MGAAPPLRIPGGAPPPTSGLRVDWEDQLSYQTRSAQQQVCESTPFMCGFTPSICESTQYNDDMYHQ